MADFNTSKVDGDTVAADEWNQLASLDNFISTSGQTPSASNLNQTPIAAARYSSGGQYYTDSGTANAYILSPVSPFKSPVSSGAGEGYFVGMTIKFRAGNANSGASTVNVNSAGVKNLKLADGTTDLPVGAIPTTTDVIFRYDGTAFCLQNYVESRTIGTSSGQIPLVGTQSATTDLAGLTQLASSSDITTGTSTTKAITPSALIGKMANSKSANGYTYLPNGLIMQWGANFLSGNTASSINFPIAFPNACFGVLASNTEAITAPKDGVSAYSWNKSSFTLSNGAVGDLTLPWFAIGY